MNIRLTYFGKVTDKLHVYRAKEMQEMILRNFAGMQVEVTIQKKRKARSLPQLKYYWGVIIPVVQSGLFDAGYKVGKEETHDFLKSMFLKVELVNEQTGEILQSVGSTSKLSTVEAMEYFQEITQWAAEFLNVEIPAPGEQIKINL